MFSFGLRAQPGAPITGRSSEVGQHQQVAGIDRRPESHHAAARPLHCARGDVLTVGDGGFAGQNDQVDLGGDGLHPRCEGNLACLLFQRNKIHLRQAAAQRREPQPQGVLKAAHHPFAGLGRAGKEQGDAPRRERGELQQTGRCGAARRLDNRLRRQGVGQDLQRGHHLARLDDGMGAQRGQRHAVAVVESAQGGDIDAQQAAFAGQQVAAAGRRAGVLQQAAAGSEQGARDAQRRLIFVDVARLKLGDVDGFAAERAQPGDIGAGQGRPLAQRAPPVGRGHVVDENFAQGVLQGNGSILHGVFILGCER